MITGHDFAIHGILCSLSIARDFERDGVVSVGSQVVTDEFDGMRSEPAVAKFRATGCPAYRLRTDHPHFR